MIKKFLVAVLMVSFLSSCIAVKPYEMVNINDPDMEFSEKKCHKYVTTFHAYREAAVGANGGKTGGGCGCN